MSQYVYDAYRSPYADSIAESIAAPGRVQAQGVLAAGQAQAQGQQQSGAIWGQALQNIGQIPQQIQQQKALAQETEMRTLQLANLKRQQASQQVLSIAIKKFTDPQTGKRDDQGIANFVSQQGYPDQGEAWLKMAVGNAENLDKLAELGRGHQKHQLETLGDLAYSANSPAEFTAAVGLAAASGLIVNAHGQVDEAKAHEIASQAATPERWARIKAQYEVFSPKYQAAQAKLKEPVKVGEGEILNTPERAAQNLPPLMTGQAKPKDEWQTFKDSYPKTVVGGTTWDKLTAEQQTAGLAAYTKAKQDPAMVALQQQSLELGNALKAIQQGQQPTADDAKTIAQQLIDHKMAPSQLQLFGGFGTAGAAFKRMVGVEALKLDPNFDWEQSESDYQFGKSAGFQASIRFMDSVQESMPQLLKNAKALANGDVRSVNALINAGKNQINDVDLKKFQTDTLLVGDEVAKILQGGGTGSATSDAKLTQAQKILSTSDSVPAIAGALEEINALLSYRRKSLVRGTYLDRPNTTTPGPIVPPKLPPGAKVDRTP